jgi:hypothetical protein
VAQRTAPVAKEGASEKETLDEELDRINLTSRIQKKPYDGKRRDDLIVNENDTVTISYTLDSFKPNYQTIYPKEIDDVKRLIGVPKEVPIKRKDCCDGIVGSVMHSDEAFQNPETRNRVIKDVRYAAREYIQGDSTAVSHWTGLINKWLTESHAELHIAVFPNIIIYDGGTLNISRDTHGIHAISIKMYGSGKIRAERDIAIDCRTLEGNIQTVRNPKLRRSPG